MIKNIELSILTYGNELSEKYAYRKEIGFYVKTTLGLSVNEFKVIIHISKSADYLKDYNIYRDFKLTYVRNSEKISFVTDMNGFDLQFNVIDFLTAQDEIKEIINNVDDLLGGFTPNNPKVESDIILRQEIVSQKSKYKIIIEKDQEKDISTYLEFYFRDGFFNKTIHNYSYNFEDENEALVTQIFDRIRNDKYTIISSFKKSDYNRDFFKNYAKEINYIPQTGEVRYTLVKNNDIKGNNDYKKLVSDFSASLKALIDMGDFIYDSIEDMKLID